METIHSRSYTHIIKNVYADPSDVFDTILKEEAIVKRAEMVTERYDHFIQLGRRRLLGLKVDDYELYKALYLALISVNILEGLRFFVSFACSFAFGELKLMEGSAKILSLIARDEAQHLAVSQHILKCYQNHENDKIMNKVMKDCESEVYEMYEDAVLQEKEWAEFLFKDGSMIGLSVPLLSNYIEYIANKRLRMIGLKPIYDISSANNPLPWTRHWFNSRGLQNAPQETEIESYVIGGIKQDVTYRREYIWRYEIMKKWYQILWGSKEEDELVRNSDGSPDPDDLTIENAYKTRWIWYHTILGLLMFFANIVLIAIFLLLAIKL